MLTHKLLTEIANASGTNEKIEIMKREKDNKILQMILQYANDPYMCFYVKKIPKKVVYNLELFEDDDAWLGFFEICNKLSMRSVTGNAAVNLVSDHLIRVIEEDEKWMRAILNKHLNIGISTKTINKVFKNLIPTFEVQLAEKFDKSVVSTMESVIVEPKLDGVRCISIVKDDAITMYARSGKQITNFADTIGKEVIKLGDGVYDGEIMSKDFQSLMSQVHRKYNIDVSDSYLALFDFVELNTWLDRKRSHPYEKRRNDLLKRFDNVKNTKHIRLVDMVVCHPEDIQENHVVFVGLGYEGSMIKDPNAKYRWGRGQEVMKLKDFKDVDLEIVGVETGTGRNENRLGAIKVNNHSVIVDVGSGFSDFQRDEFWKDRDRLVGMIAEIRYQEETEDGSLRFPTFVRLRSDK